MTAELTTAPTTDLTADRTVDLTALDAGPDADALGASDLQVPLTDDLVVDLLEDVREVAGVLGVGYPVVPPRQPDAG